MSETFFGLSIQVPVAVNVLLVAFLTVLAGMMAGLILCVFSLDVNRLTVMLNGPNYKESQRAKRVLTILEKPHWLLITLLLWDDLALEMMPLLLHMFLHPAVAVVVSVAITLVFCEIIPQATFIHNAFTVSAFLAPFICFLMWLSAPVAWPIGKLLDIIVGDKETVFFQRRELRALIRLQEELLEQKRHEPGNGSETQGGGENTDGEDTEDDLTKEEVTIMLNVLSMSESTAKGMLQAPIESMYRLHIDAPITQEIVDIVFNNGYNFIPIYEDAKNPSSVTHVLMTKALLLLAYRSEEGMMCVRDLPLMLLSRFPGTTRGTDIFAALQDLSPSIAAITDGASDRVVGILTLRNVVELVHQTTFKEELDPRNPSPMQLMMGSWKVFRRVGVYSIEVSGRPSNPSESAGTHPLSPVNERILRHSLSSERLNIAAPRVLSGSALLSLSDCPSDDVCNTLSSR